MYHSVYQRSTLDPLIGTALSSPYFFFFYSSGPHRNLHSFPTRRSSDLAEPLDRSIHEPASPDSHFRAGAEVRVDRKSTRLNSSHITISYAVFCLKKKKTKKHKCQFSNQELSTTSSARTETLSSGLWQAW